MSSGQVNKDHVIAILVSYEICGVTGFQQGEEHSVAEIIRQTCYVSSYNVMKEDLAQESQGWGHRCARRKGDKDNIHLWLRLSSSSSTWKLLITSFLAQLRAKQLPTLQQDHWCIKVDEKFMNGVNNWLDTLAALFFFYKWLKKLVSVYDKWLNLGGDPTGKYCSMYVSFVCNTVFFHLFFFFLASQLEVDSRLVLE